MLGGIDKVDEARGMLGAERRLSVRRASAQISAMVAWADTTGADDDSEAQRRPSVALVPRGSVTGTGELAELADVFKTSADRDAIMRVWQHLRATHSDGGWVVIITKAATNGLNLNFPTDDGESMLYMAVQRQYKDAVRSLLALGVETGVQVTAMVSFTAVAQKHGRAVHL